METINDFLKNFNKYLTLKNMAYGAFALVGLYVAFKKAKIAAGRLQMQQAIFSQARVMQQSTANSQAVTQQMVNPVPVAQGVGGADYSSEIKKLRDQLGTLAMKLKGVEGENAKMRQWIDEVQNAANNQGPNMPDGVDPNGKFYFER